VKSRDDQENWHLTGKWPVQISTQFALVPL
jgi:hypothetical protein